MKVLFIVPHEDDEVFIGGPMILNLAHTPSYEIYVFISTNGDYYPFENSIRVKESVDGLMSMGVNKENIYFGGYGDSWKGKHIYNSSQNQQKESHGGFFETYVDSNIYTDWHFKIVGKHAKYTRSNYLSDIISLIHSILPEVIIAVDMDSHPDHRCLSLLVDEAMSYILKCNSNYNPILLKKFAYQGCYKGARDYFYYPTKTTQLLNESPSNPYFLWNNRISYKVPKACDTIFIRNNLLYKIIRKYKSQGAWVNSDRFINSDIVYWQRSTKNLTLKSKLYATSGNVEFLNDFKLLDTDDVLLNECNYKMRCWRPSLEDREKSITIELFKESVIKRITLYINNLYESSNKNEGKVIYLLKNTAIHKSTFSIPSTSFGIVNIDTDKILCDEIIFDFSKAGDNLGIGEIEILPNIDEVPFKEFLYTSNQYKKSNFLKFIKLLDALSFIIQRIINKILSKIVPNSFIRNRKKYDRKLTK